MKQAAHDAGLSLDELARRIGCSRALIYQYASGAALAQNDRLQQIAREVGKPLYWFFIEDLDAAQSATELANLATERAQVDAELDRLAADRSRLEQRRASEDVAHLEALLAAYSTPANPRKVVDCCTQLTPLLAREEDPQRLASVLLQQGNALLQLQEWGAAKEKLEQAAGLFRQASRLTSARDCVQSLGHVNLMLGRVDEALQQFETVASGDDWSNRWQGTLSVGGARELLGDYPAAIAAFERALEIVEERGDTPGAEAGRLYVEANWANLELDFGDYQGALERSLRCIRMALRLGVQDQYMEALLTNGAAYLQIGDTQSATRSVQLALDVADLTSDQQHRSLALSYLSLCDTVRRRTPEAIAEGKEALALALRCSAVRAEIVAQRALCEAYLQALNPSEAVYHARQGLVVAQNIRLLLPQAHLGALKAQAQLMSGNSADAIVEGERALKLAADLHARPVEIECHLVLAQAYFDSASIDDVFNHAGAVIDLARNDHLPNITWKAHFLLARANAARSDLAVARSEYQHAILELRTAREVPPVIKQEADTSLEDPLALQVWQSWLQFVVETEGADQARVAAAEAEWPPLNEWLESQLQDKGGAVDA